MILIRETYPEGREALRTMIRESMGRKRKTYIHVNNRLEGNANSGGSEACNPTY